MSAVDDTFDNEADEVIRGCLDIRRPQSFFLHAGAGSGKTRSLVTAVRAVTSFLGESLRLSRRKVAVVTYTNAACDEVRQRINFDARVEVATIHAFSWSLISGFDDDIREWLSVSLRRELAELEVAQSKGRSGTKAASDRSRSIEAKRRRLDRLGTISRFVYSPVGDNRSRDALSHSEVISITADFLRAKSGLQRMLVNQYPILFIDESQDTNARLLESFMHIAGENERRFCLGLFGDTMQRIYADGLENLAESIPATWARPRKRMNHRCPTRIVELINRIRRDADREEQLARSDAPEGSVRLVVASNRRADPVEAERQVAERMAVVADDPGWLGGSASVKTLALEHLMSARRFGFASFFEPLYSVPSIRTSFLQGTGAGVGLFTGDILPLVAAIRAADEFRIASIVRQSSPLLDRRVLEEAGEGQADALAIAKRACDGLAELVLPEESVSARSILQYVAETRLFAIPDVLAPFAESSDADGSSISAREEEPHDSPTDEGTTDDASVMVGWGRALDSPLDEIERYAQYVRGESQFDTHQGVKGREFPRVMVVVSDHESRGFMFAYDKLFEAKGKSKRDLENEAAGRETTIDRTRRLFYVTCSRAQQSLAVVYYADDVEEARAKLGARGWFRSDQIERVD